MRYDGPSILLIPILPICSKYSGFPYLPKIFYDIKGSCLITKKGMSFFSKKARTFLSKKVFAPRATPNEAKHKTPI